MTIKKATTEEILSKNLHYTTLCSEIIEIITRKYGAETLALFTFLMAQSPKFVIRKSYICKILKLSERGFQRGMQNLQELELSYLANGERDSAGRLAGKTWHVFGLPRQVIQQLDTFFSRNADYLNSAQSVPVTGPVPGAPHDGATNDQAQLPTDCADHQQSVNCAHLTSNKQKQTSYELISNTFAQNEFARFYSQYPRKRDRGRAFKAFKQLIKGKSNAEITTLVDTCILNVNARIKSGEWNDIDFIPYAKAYLNPDNEAWNEVIYDEHSAIRRGVESGKTVDEIFNADIHEAFDDHIVVHKFGDNQQETRHKNA